ncbi:ATP-binding protein [Streptomyces sp. IF17]|nr:ATP-binding protein [Streptomyces alkaliphilus]
MHSSPPVSAPPLAPSPAFRASFPSSPAGARTARRAVAVWLSGRGLSTEDGEAVTLLVAELASNAVRHGHVPGRDFRLLLRLSGRPEVARVEITDTQGERLPPRPGDVPSAPDTAEGGRGLRLVAALATRWDWQPRPDGPGKTVWAEYALGRTPGPGRGDRPVP